MTKKQTLDRLKEEGVKNPEERYNTITKAIFNHNKFITLSNIVIAYASSDTVVNNIYALEKDKHKERTTPLREINGIEKFLIDSDFKNLKGIELKRFIRGNKEEIEIFLGKAISIDGRDSLHKNAKEIKIDVCYKLTANSLFQIESVIKDESVEVEQQKTFNI